MKSRTRERDREREKFWRKISTIMGNHWLLSVCKAG